MKLLCLKAGHKGGIWSRQVEFPFPPFPGMYVGSHVVLRVLVCQSGLDGEGEIDVHLNRALKREEEILRNEGWQYSE